jgi:hypothetical protein
MSSTSPIQSQQQQQQQQQQQISSQARRRILDLTYNHNHDDTCKKHAWQKSRNSNAYFNLNDDYHRSASIDCNHEWTRDHHNNDHEYYFQDYYRSRPVYTLANQRLKNYRTNQMKQQDQTISISSSLLSSNKYPCYDENVHAYSGSVRRRRRRRRRRRPVLSNNEQEYSTRLQAVSNDVKPSPSSSSSSSSNTIDSQRGDHAVTINQKGLQTKNLATAAIAARQQNQQIQSNIGVVQTLMNSLIVQQQQQPLSSSSSTVQLQNQLTNALLATRK